MVDVKVTVTVYNLDGKDCSLGIDTPHIEVKSDPDLSEMVSLIVGGHEYSVSAEDMLMAVSKASGTH